MKYVCLLFLFFCNEGEAQESFKTFSIESKIEKVTLADTFLIQQIRLFIAETKITDTNFVNKGYIHLSVSKRAYKNEPVLKSYFINKDYFSFDNIENDNLFSPYYSVIDGKIVIIRLFEMNQIINYRFSNEVKNEFQQIIEPYLFPKPSTSREGMWRGGGKYLWIFNSKRPPLVLTADQAGLY